MRKLGFFLVLLFAGLIACEADLGEACDEEGISDGECDEGLVCGKKSPTDDSLVCLKQCTNPADCGGNEDCGDVGNTSLKGCRPKR